MFHLMTHAFFKAVLFLAAGSVIIALHHEQDMRRMGGLRKYLPITYWTMLIGAIASAGIPGFAGFFSKDAIIGAIHHSPTPGAGFAYFCVVACVFVTAAYTFRLVFMAFHGKPRFDPHHPPHESPPVVTVPLVLLAVPSVLAGYLVGDFVFGDYFGDALPAPDPNYFGIWQFIEHGLISLPFWLALAGIATAWLLYMRRPDLPARVANFFGPAYSLVERKYGFDELYSLILAGGARALGKGFWRGGDQAVIDGLMVNGTARLTGWFSGVVALLQSGMIYRYASVMLMGVVILAFWFLKN
jgi:NADH-quinone oxidoreductase subunit L